MAIARPMPRLAPVTIPVMAGGFRMSYVECRRSPARFESVHRSTEIRNPTSEILFSYLDGVLQRETEPGLSGNADSLSLGQHLHRSSCACAGGGADGCSFTTAENTAQDGAYRGRASDDLTALASPRVAGRGDFLCVEVHHSAINPDRNQVQGQLGAAADLARLFFLHQLVHDIRAPTYTAFPIRSHT